MFQFSCFLPFYRRIRPNTLSKYGSLEAFTLTAVSHLDTILVCTILDGTVSFDATIQLKLCVDRQRTKEMSLAENLSY